MVKSIGNLSLRDKLVEEKIIRVSDKRQITIPLRFYEELGFEKDAVCYIDGDSIIIKPLSRSGREYSEFILADLLKEGFEGEELLNEFIRRQEKIRPAILSMIADAEQAAHDPSNYTTVDDLFAGDN